MNVFVCVLSGGTETDHSGNGLSFDVIEDDLHINCERFLSDALVKMSLWFVVYCPDALPDVTLLVNRAWDLYYCMF